MVRGGPRRTCVPCRVVRIDKGGITVAVRPGDERLVVAAKAVRRVVVGDVCGLDEPAGRIEAILPRRTVFERRSPGVSRDQVQLRSRAVAANMDLVYVLQPLDPGLNTGRLARELVLAWESGAQPVVVLTKADLVTRRADRAAASPMPGATRPVSRCTRSRPAPATGSTSSSAGRGAGDVIALLGASGAGKSTLVNALAGHHVQLTAEVRDSDRRGRHTTSAGQMVELIDGALLIDTPGIRGVGLWSVRRGHGTRLRRPGAVRAAVPLRRLHAHQRARVRVGRRDRGRARSAPTGSRSGGRSSRSSRTSRRVSRSGAASESVRPTSAHVVGCDVATSTAWTRPTTSTTRTTTTGLSPIVQVGGSASAQAPYAAVMARAAATTASPCCRPGDRPRRSIGPDTLTAARIAPSRSTHRRRDRGDARLRARRRSPASPTRLRSPDSARPAEPRSIGSAAPTGDDRAQPVGRLQRGDAHAGVAVAHVELHRLTGRVAQLGHRRTGRQRRAGTAPPPRRPSATRCSPRAKRPSSRRRSMPCASSATASRCAVARLSPVPSTSSASEHGPAGDQREDRERLVDHADAAYSVFHQSGTVSHILRSCHPGRRTR